MRPDFHLEGQIAPKFKNRPVLVGFRHTQVSMSSLLTLKFTSDDCKVFADFAIVNCKFLC